MVNSKVTKVIERDMKILKIKDRIIYVEIPKLRPILLTTTVQAAERLSNLNT